MNIEGTKTTPSVSIEPGIIEVRGRSIPEDSFEFYQPVLNGIFDYFTTTELKTEINFHLEYINSGSKKFITNILGVVNEFYHKGRSIIIQWYYDFDDESMQELGNDLRGMIQIPFHLIEVNQEN
jgi:hypothetical protein